MIAENTAESMGRALLAVKKILQFDMLNGQYE
jgi:hypothetical protein